MKTGLVKPLGTVSGMITADGEAGCHRGAVVPVSCPVPGRSPAVQPPGRQGASPGVLRRDLRGPSLPRPGCARTGRNGYTDAVSRAGGTAGQGACRARGAGTGGPDTVAPSGAGRVGTGGDLKGSGDLPGCGGPAGAGQYPGALVRAYFTSGNVANASGAFRGTRPEQPVRSGVPGGGWLLAGAAGLHRVTVRAPAGAGAALRSRALNPAAGPRRLLALPSPQHERIRRTGYRERHVLAA